MPPEVYFIARKAGPPLAGHIAALALSAVLLIGALHLIWGSPPPHPDPPEQSGEKVAEGG